MRHLSVLLTLALVASSSFAGVVDTTAPPDIRQLPNSATVDAFNLNDYFATNNAGAATFSGADADGSVDVPGAAAVGLTDLSASIAVGGDSADVSFTRKVSSFMLSGGSMPGDAMFVQCLRAGVAASSAAPLTGGPAGGPAGGGGSPGGGTPGGGTPGGGTPGGSAAWMITFANVTAGTTATGLATRTSAVTASGQDSLTAGGLTASIDANGNYTLSSTASFAGPVVVTFVKKAGNDMDSASVVAAAAKSVGANFAGNLDAGRTVTSTGDAVNVFDVGSVVASGKVRISVDYASDGAGCALGAMDSNTFNGTAGQNLAMISVGGSEVMANGTLATTFEAVSGEIALFLQVGSAGTVTFSNIQVCAADAATTYAAASGALDLAGVLDGAAIAGDLSGGVASLFTNLNSANDTHNPVTAAAANNFDTPGSDGSIALTAKSADGSLSNASVFATGFEAPGVLRVVCNAQKAAGGSGFLAVVLSALGATGPDLAFFTTFVDVPNIASGGWTEVDTYGAVNDGSGGLLVTVQNAGGDSVVNVDDLAVYTVLDTPETFDATLLGL